MTEMTVKHLFVYTYEHAYIFHVHICVHINIIIKSALRCVNAGRYNNSHNSMQRYVKYKWYIMVGHLSFNVRIFRQMLTLHSNSDDQYVFYNISQ